MRKNIRDAIRVGCKRCRSERACTEQRRDTRKFKLHPDGPKREKMSPDLGYSHVNNSVMRRYLKSSVGRRWDDVYSDICKFTRHLSKDEMHQLLWQVERHIEMREGIPHTCTGSSWRWTRNRSDDGWSPVKNGYFWVDPKTGILKEWKEKALPPKKKPVNRIIIDYYNQCVKEKGVWYWWRWKPFVKNSQQRWTGSSGTEYWYDLDYDSIQKEWLTKRAASSLYGALVVGVFKKQMNKREIKKFIPEGDR